MVCLHKRGQMLCEDTTWETENLAAFFHFAADADSFITLALPNRSDLMLNAEQTAKSVLSDSRQNRPLMVGIV